MVMLALKAINVKNSSGVEVPSGINFPQMRRRLLVSGEGGTGAR